ncbi:MAG: site-specific integrase [Actinomycetota bacterium]
MPGDDLTLTDWVHDYWLPLMRSQVKPSTFDSYRRNLDLHVLPYLGQLPLHQITPLRLNRLYAELLKSGRRNGPGGLSAKTVRYLHTTIHGMLADAVEAEVIAANPASRAKAPRPSRVAPIDLHFWTPEELRRFLHFTRGHPLAVAWRLAAMTGMRRGEVLGLRWADVDLDLGRLAVRHAIISVAYEILESTPKTHHARVIDLDTETGRQLRAHHNRQEGERTAAAVVGDLVFGRPDGEPIHPDSFSQAFDRVVARSGLPRIRLHDLRHSHATIALRAGVPAKVISERLGHSTPAFTLHQYAHVIPGMQAEAAAQIATLVDQNRAA